MCYSSYELQSSWISGSNHIVSNVLYISIGNEIRRERI